MGKIKELSALLTNQIAAGEVIQRPASVIKELVENAVDACARNIHVTVTDAGRTNIQVIDDGKGMSETDARLAFERHSTSKIRKADDLFALRTMGFRGEALASIAAVAQVELKSRQATDEIGTLIQISGSRYEKQEPCSCAVGSIFSVSNIFYNVPARRKFLKSNSTELNNILTAFERIALVNPQITFTFHSNGTEVFNLRAANLRQRILDVFGKRFNQELLPVNVETTMCKVSGFVGKPESARKKGVHQFFFVNGRYMKHPYFNKAVMAAYDRLVPQGEQVPYFLYFDVDPKDIDVNIHPTKTEIKFENEQAIWQILSASVKESIGMFNDVPTIDFDTEDKPDIPVYNPEMSTAAVAPKISLNPGYNPFKSSSSTGAVPMGAGFHAVAAGIQKNKGHAYMGSLNVLADGDPLSGGGAHLHMNCCDVGIPSPHTAGQVAKHKEVPTGVPVYLPTGVINPIPMSKQVLTNPVPTPLNPISFFSGTIKSSFGRLFKKAKKKT